MQIKKRKENEKMILIAERAMDELGRIVLPNELRQRLGIATLSKLSIYENNGEIVIKKAAPTCRICGAPMSPDDDYVICASCIRDVKELPDHPFDDNIKGKKHHPGEEQTRKGA